MIIYYEALISINTIVHYNFSTLTNHIVHEKNNKWRLILSSIMTNIYLVMYLNYNFLEIFKFLFLIILSLVAFKKKKSLFVYALLNIFLGGSCYVLKAYANNIYLLSIIMTFVIIIIMEIYIRKKVEIPFRYDVYINDYQKSAFLDTGNNLLVKGKPVIFVNNIINEKKIDEVIINTVSGTSTIGIFENTSIFIVRNGEKILIDCYVAFSNIEYDVLLNINLIDILRER